MAGEGSMTVLELMVHWTWAGKEQMICVAGKTHAVVFSVEHIPEVLQVANRTTTQFMLLPLSRHVSVVMGLIGARVEYERLDIRPHHFDPMYYRLLDAIENDEVELITIKKSGSRLKTIRALSRKRSNTEYADIEDTIRSGTFTSVQAQLRDGEIFEIVCEQTWKL